MNAAQRVVDRGARGGDVAAGALGDLAGMAGRLGDPLVTGARLVGGAAQIPEELRLALHVSADLVDGAGDIADLDAELAGAIGDLAHAGNCLPSGLGLRHVHH